LTGFELNDVALKQNLSRISPLYCYDIHERALDIQGLFDMIVLFDVLEHIDDEKRFLESIKHHMTKPGRLLVNVPAHQFLYSTYDRTVGHVRRYSSEYLKSVAETAGFRVTSFTYWGVPLIPLLILRKALLAIRRRSEEEIVSSGFDPGQKALNSALMLLARCEVVPQKLVGTSLMAVLERT